jgi:hypothetical protein
MQGIVLYSTEILHSDTNKCITTLQYLVPDFATETILEGRLQLPCGLRKILSSAIWTSKSWNIQDMRFSVCAVPCRWRPCDGPISRSRCSSKWQWTRFRNPENEWPWAAQVCKHQWMERNNIRWPVYDNKYYSSCNIINCPLISSFLFRSVFFRDLFSAVRSLYLSLM